MIMKICAVRDRAVDAFGQPFFVKAIGEAIRSFQDEVNREGSVFAAHPDDYDLYHIGDYDDSNAVITPIAAKQLLLGKECVKN